MVQIAEARVGHLFRLAAREAAQGPGDLPDRYVRLARRIGARYNVRLGAQLRERYCRGCSAFWIEGRTVRTRLRSGRTIRTCLRCGRVRRISRRTTGPLSRGDRAAPSAAPARTGDPLGPDGQEPDDDGTEPADSEER